MKFLFFLLIIISYNLNSQSKFIGLHCKDYKTKDFSTCYNFNKGLFVYEHIGDIGVIEYGAGNYQIKNDSLFLNFDKTKSRNTSKVKLLSKTDSFKDSIQLKFIVRNQKQVLTYPYNGSIEIKDKGYTSLNKNNVVFVKNNFQDSIVIKYRNLGFDPLEINLKSGRNYVIEISLGDFSGKPIFYKKEYYKVEEFLNNYNKN
ncbi:hypothetical protein H9W90_14475 [Polaribacter pectinis]|uniref:Uncharacterized protein n=1 Tax=Polaribacter pectinis TaxID=2738844 RepID=A0A7G9L9S5_9FLAO|nr:hypothetical protein [Polaribacter pectinis]QNM85374.1 hypothetical protein H9W90_14475 [Polaribacter pectinis]